MKYLYKYIFSFLLITTISTEIVNAQDNRYNWRLGFGVGYSTYYGDLSNYRIHGAGDLYKIYRFGNYNSYYQHQPSLSLLLQKKLTPTLGIMFQANYLQFAMSDRYRKNNGSLDTAAANYSRSLNFRTTMQDAGLAFTFSPNNGRIGSETAFFYPSFYVGLGVSKFVVKGDLYDSKNSPYNYTLPGNINDGNFETDLRDQQTETDNKFRNVEPYVDLGLALNFRISSLLSIALQSDIKYSASDYLDDVSSVYKTSYPTTAQAYAAKPGYNVVDPVTRQRGDNNGVNDFYINNRIVLNITLARKKPVTKFKPPVIYSLNPSYYPDKKIRDSVKKAVVLSTDSIVRVKNDSAAMAKKDSMLQAQYAIIKSQRAPDSAVSKQLDNINTELKGIKEILRDQQYRPRLQQLQYQTDSIKNLKGRLLNQRPVSKENNLMLRVYDLQVDSLRNEYDKVQRRQNLPLTKADSAILFSRTTGSFKDYTTKEYTTVQDADKFVVRSDRNDSIQIRNNYQKKIDSIQRRLNELENAPPASYRADSLQKINRTRSIDSLNALKNKAEADNKLQRDEHAVAVLEQQVKSANDSTAYYKRLRNNPKETVTTDTVQKKIPWYQRYLGIGKKKKSKIKTDSMPAVGYEKQQQFYESEANLSNKKIDKIEKEKTEVAVQRMNYTRDNNLKIDSAEYDRNLNLVQKRIQRNSDSISLLQRQVQRSNDSSAYYKKMMLETSDKTNAENRKWYQDLFVSERKKQNRIDDQKTVSERNVSQQQYYDSDVKNMQNQINDLQRRNADLQNSYQSYNSDRYVRRGNDFPVSPVVVYDGNNNNNRGDRREIGDLRAQLQNLQNEMNYDARGRSITDSTSSSKPQQIIVTPAPVVPTQVAPADTTQVSALRGELNQLRLQLDSIKNKPVAVPKEAPVKPEAKYDVTGFPVVSVYFKLGSVSLSADQLNKISPLARVASKNTDAGIVLKGFTDPVGNPEKNRIIANKRSEYIKNVLLTKYKISDARIIIEEPEISQSGGVKKANPLDRRVDLQFK